MTPYPAFTPVILLTGFLGSGKTTLLARLLKDPALADTAVLINEFGAVGLDHHLLDRIDGEMVLLSSGCLCCTIRGELADAIKNLHSRRDRGAIPPFRRIWHAVCLVTAGCVACGQAGGLPGGLSIGRRGSSSDRDDPGMGRE